MAKEFAETLRKIEEQWQQAWNDAGIFQPDPGEEDKFYITVAYPYPSGSMHIGHVRTYTLPDVFARFKRMQGFNVLFPMAWHVTGTPIVGALQRLQEGEEKQLHVLQDVFNVPQDALEAMEEPMDFASYFIDNSYRPGMQKLGFGVDWRREFTTNDPRYNRFIEWQYKRLREQGLVKKGLHPTKYDVKTGNPVTTHDLLEGEDAEKQEYTLVKFTDAEGRVFPMATLRPETVYGVTHTLIDPDGVYVTADVDGETWIVSTEAAEKLDHQDHDVEILEEVEGRSLVGTLIENPVTDDTVLLLPASFIDTDAGSGIVMSVPAHAPYDWISLQELQETADELEAEYGVDAAAVRSIEPVSIIEVDGFGEFPAKDACEEHGVETQEDAALEAATKAVYEKEFHTGVLKENCGQFSGDYINAVKERLIETFEADGVFDAVWDFSEQVVSRSGGKVIVSLQESWFIDYADKGWKDRVADHLDEMNIIPGDRRDEYNHTVDWLESWPCIRNYGLGTPMPFDDEFIIEPLSDSTIYMAFYTISHLINDVDPEKLDPVFFDYVFRGEGAAEAVADTTGIPEETVEAAWDSFRYWYPLDWRTSAHDLVQNHLTFMVFHHTALFPRDMWPQGIATWGMGTLEGEKMSSSKGHVVLADEAITEYGADTTRFFLFSNAEPWQDFDWRGDEVETYRNKLRRFHTRVQDLYDSGEEQKITRIDRYLLSRCNSIVKTATEGLEQFQTRKASLAAFFELNNAIDWYRSRAETVNTPVLNQVLETQLKLLSPFIPHLTEELWHSVGHDTLLATEDWPRVDEEKIDAAIEDGETMIQSVADDIQEIANLVDDYNRIELIVADDWKRDAVTIIQEAFDEDVKDVGAIMDRLMQEDALQPYGEDLSTMVQNYRDQPGDLPSLLLPTGEEYALFDDAADFLETRFDADITVTTEEQSSHRKAGRAQPGTPAIVLE